MRFVHSHFVKAELTVLLEEGGEKTWKGIKVREEEEEEGRTKASASCSIEKVGFLPISWEILQGVLGTLKCPTFFMWVNPFEFLRQTT